MNTLPNDLAELDHQMLLDEAVYITKAQAMAFFGLVDPAMINKFDAAHISNLD